MENSRVLCDSLESYRTVGGPVQDVDTIESHIAPAIEQGSSVAIGD